MAVSKRLRFEILRRDNHTCRYCGRSAPEVKLTVDHVIPETLGGADAADNLVAACSDCNNGKSSVPADAPLVASVHERALQWAAAMQLAAQQRADRQEPMLEYLRAFLDEWDRYQIGSNIYDPVLPDNAEETVERFYKAGLPIDELTKAVGVAMTRRKVSKYDKFRYMCGICWSVLTELQEEAKRFLEENGE